ncbi:ATP-dependent DNA helicase MPH1 [Echria macrotheca]|uniref:ATP-dependent DNA helicase n=1 Tax=Echria macrotheca TaxID=438768 RepID=A0AAJ0F723_9PEZI|nr:ATP-dependent DNA helicase MPH1 [Echria macrotheca]
MDDDEFDEIPDEDLMEALDHATQAPTADFLSDFDSPPRTGNTSMLATRGWQNPQSLRQTTLSGTTLNQSRSSQATRQNSGRPFRADLPAEVPTHHELDREALRTWVYPLNLGAIRDYQFSIVKNGLFNNTLVALPTGLGKTFIAATIMLNFLRWTTKAKVVFVAPTKPLASQQVEACLNIVGIPRSQTTLLTGDVAPVLREDEWATKRLFFMTPQTLMNDLSKGYADPKSIVLLVIDEAHRATGDYAYVKVVQFIRRFSKSFRVLALTATPGSTVEGVQAVIDNLEISHVEVRTEESIDIRQYIHSRAEETILFDPSDEMQEIKVLFSKALKPMVDKLSAQNIYFGRDPMGITTFGLLKSRNEWIAGPGKHANNGLKFSMLAVFGLLQSLAHSIKLLDFHGIKPFYNYLCNFRDTEESKKGPGSKNKRQLLEDESFQKMMSMIRAWLGKEGFIGHPKLSYLCEALVNHFVDAGEESSTRAIVFCEYRDSAEDIVQLLNTQPLVRAKVFVGQADSRKSEGMKQKDQIETIEKFKNGGFNVLVATSIGEEGLDIGQVDLIICYDASSSPIRMLQRMGRTGRKRAGKVLALLMKGKEQDKFNSSKHNYREMQALICEGSRFAFRHDLSTRIVPRDVKPEVDKRIVEIPIENTQNTALPEPRKATGARRKPAQKKFNMPDGVETGFVKASVLSMLTSKTSKASKTPMTRSPPQNASDIAPIPDLDQVALSQHQIHALDRLYRDLPLGNTDMVEISYPDMCNFPAAQRTLRPTVHLDHGEYTKRCVGLFKTLGRPANAWDLDLAAYNRMPNSWLATVPVPPFAGAENDTPAVQKRQRDARLSGDEQDTLEPLGPPKKRQATSTRGGRANRTPQRPEMPQAIPSNSEEDGNEAEDVMTPLPSRRGRGRGRGKATTARAKKGGPKKSRLKRSGDHLEDMGDDCTRTSDLAETDGSDSGGDLVGFIVDDNHITSSMKLLSTSPSMALSSPNRPRRAAAATANRALKTTQWSAPIDLTSESSSDDMPDLATLAKQGQVVEANAKAAKKPSPKKSRRVIFDSSDDDDDDNDDF